MNPTDLENNDTNDALVMPDDLSVSSTIVPADSVLPPESTFQTVIPEEKEDLLKDYFKQTDESADKSTVLNDVSGQSAAATDSIITPAEPVISPPPPVVPPPVTKPDPTDPFVIEQKKAQKKMILKYIFVFFNFALTAFLIYYYMYLGKQK